MEVAVLQIALGRGRDLRNERSTEFSTTSVLVNSTSFGILKKSMMIIEERVWSKKQKKLLAIISMYTSW